MTENGKKEEFREILVIDSMNYLKFPEKFKKEWGLDVFNVQVPNPVGSFMEVKNDKVYLTYVWDENDLKKCKEVKK